MFCGRCGSPIADDARFCPNCGADVAETASAGAPSATSAQAPDAAPGDLGAQVAHSRRRSRHQMPLIRMIVLALLAFAVTAAAAIFIYQVVIRPQIEAQAQREAEEQLAAEQAAEEEAQTEELAAQRAVYDGILTQYRDAQAAGWSEARDSELADLANLAFIITMQQDMNVGVTCDQIAEGTLSYAYTDLGEDGVLDLVIAVTQADGSYQVLGAFSTDGDSVTSLMDGDLLARSYWDVLDGGRLRNTGSDGAFSGSAASYTVEDGRLVLERMISNRDGAFTETFADGSTAPADLDAYNEITGEAVCHTLEWQPLDAFEAAS